MSDPQAKIESLLLVAQRPISIRKISTVVEADPEDVEKAIEALRSRYEDEQSGFRILRDHARVQLVTSPQQSSIVKAFLRDETSGELTRASLEALTVIAYRGPMTRLELELIRGVNCSVILRNLLIRGLIDEIQEKNDLVARYHLTLDFMKHLGLNRIEDLPDYEKLHKNIALDEFLQKAQEVQAQES
jgi:segregation and condensation protein B